MATNALGDDILEESPHVNDPIVSGPGRGGSAPPPSTPDPVSNALSHAGSRLAELPSAFGTAVIHPVDTVKGMYGQQKQLAGEGIDAAKSGDYPLAIARGVETLMPGVGPAIANGFKTIKSGDTSGGIGDMLGTVGPAIALRAASLSPKVRAFTRGAVDAAKEPTSAHVGPFRVSVPVPAPLAGAVTGSVIGGHFGMPGLGATVGTIAPLIRGGMRAAEGEDWLPSVPASFPNPFSVPGHRLLNRGGMAMPPTDTPDPSGDYSYTGMAHPPNPSRALPAGPRVITPSPPNVADPSGDYSYTGMAHPPNPARALPSGSRPIITQPPVDPSGDYSYTGQYPEIQFDPRESEIVAPSLTLPESPASPPMPVTPSGVARIGTTPAERITALSQSDEGTLGTRAEMMRQLRLADQAGASNSAKQDIIRRFERPEYTPRQFDPRESEVVAPGLAVPESSAVPSDQPPAPSEPPTFANGRIKVNVRRK